MNRSLQSAGLLPYRFGPHGIEVFLVHPGGPFWVKKDEGAWSVAKGEFGEEEDAREAALREFEEETGIRAQGPFIALTPVRQKSGKRVQAWATEMNPDAALIRSNTFELEWPPKSGRIRHFPEVDRAAWFSLTEARLKINPAQAAFLDELAERIG